MSLTFLEKDACSAVLHDALLHGETLLVVSSSNFENVALVVLAHILSIDLLSHSLLIEWTTATGQRKKLAIERDKLSCGKEDANSGRTLTSCFHHQSQLSFAHQSGGLQY